jgi:protein-disulfide isomerase
MQPQSCMAAYAAQSAKLQGKFWPYHDRIFSADFSEGETAFKQIAEEIGLDLSKFDEDRNSEAVKSVVQEDVDLGNQRGVNATPSVFINGRSVPALNYDVLKSLIQYELDSI